MEKTKTFLICPVRGHNPKETEDIVKRLEEKGYIVHWPPRDVNQVDETGGYRICCDNRQAMEDADCVHIVWDGKSQGCLFDIGMAFILRKKIHIVQIPPPSTEKSFQNMINRWYKETKDMPDGTRDSDGDKVHSYVSSFRGVNR